MYIKQGNNCHKDLSGVMANSGFGKLVMRGRDGVMHEIPAACIKKTNGCLKNNWRGIFIREMGYAIPA